MILIQRLSLFFVIIGVLDVGADPIYLKNGLEYLYATEMSVTVGTTDHAEHSSGTSIKMDARIQPRNNIYYLELSNIKYTQYVGKGGIGDVSPFSNTAYTDLSHGPVSFAVKINSGVFDSLQIPNDTPLALKNVMKAWASMLQINPKKAEANSQAFTALESTLHGICNISYLITPVAIYKSVSHMRDCSKHVYKISDHWGGHTCNRKFHYKGKDTTEGIYSSSETIIKVGHLDGEPVISNFIVTGVVSSEFYGLEGISHLTVSKHASKLTKVGARQSGPIQVEDGAAWTNDVSYEWSDKELTWDNDRNLKDREPFLSSGNFLSTNQGSIKDAIGNAVKTLLENTRKYSIDAADVQTIHQSGLNAIMPLVYAADYDTLNLLATEYLQDKSEIGISHSNLYNELLATAGTVPAALLIKDLVMNNKFDNDRDSARILSGIPFHIRRPNMQLLQVFEELLDFEAETYTKMAIPLMFGHLVKVTCKHAGTGWGFENQLCIEKAAKKYSSLIWKKYTDSTDREEKLNYIRALGNLEYGNVCEKLEPIFYSKSINETDSQFKVAALVACSMESFYDGNIYEKFMPIFADSSYSHEVRIVAFSMIMRFAPTAVHLDLIMNILKHQNDFEVFNFVFTTLEKFASSIDPCEAKTMELAKHYIRYMRKVNKDGADYSFGVSKTYQRQFQQKKYGYGGGYSYYVIGSKHSTTPVSFGVSLLVNDMKTYKTELIGVHIRSEGLAKAIVRKLKNMDTDVWNIDTLKSLLYSQMSIKAREQQQIHVQIDITLKGVVVFHREYNEHSLQEGGHIHDLIATLQSLSKTYLVNHQRAIQVGSFVYEQPTDIGLPMAYMNSLNTLVDIRATVKKGMSRGLIFREIEYDVHISGQHSSVMIVYQPLTGIIYAATHDRVYQAHFPRKIVAGFHLFKKKLLLNVNRPTTEKPLMLMAHSQNIVAAKSNQLDGKIELFNTHCPTCDQRTVVSDGTTTTDGRVIVDYENEAIGAHLKANYFDCEADTSKANVYGHVIAAFMSSNKNLGSIWTMVSMGVRQIRAYLLHFPLAAKCGVMVTWSQSKVNPVEEIKLKITAKSTSNGNIIFFRGKDNKIEVSVIAVGKPQPRRYIFQIDHSYSPGRIINNVDIKIHRSSIPNFISSYSICGNYQSKYSNFSSEFFDYDQTRELTLSGKAKLQYGPSDSCENAEGVITLDINHSTSLDAISEIKQQDYAQKCIEQTRSSSWIKRAFYGYPVTDECFQMIEEITKARNYKWNVEFLKTTDNMKIIIAKFQGVIQTLGLMGLQSDSETTTDLARRSKPFISVEASFTDNDKALTIDLETSQGRHHFTRIPLSLNWNKHLRNMKFSRAILRLKEMGLLNQCTATVNSITTLDKVTYPYQSSNCWTLISSHCGQIPSYAVFVKKSDSLPLAAKVYIGGHVILLEPTSGGSIAVSINGNAITIENGSDEKHIVKGQEIMQVFKWGNTYNIYSYLKLWVVYDGHFIGIIPPPSVKGEHCGMCGNFNKDKHDEFTGKRGYNLLKTSDEMAEEWKLDCP